MKNMSATKKGSGHRPQMISNIRYKKESKNDFSPCVADFSGAKLARKAIAKTLTKKH